MGDDRKTRKVDPEEALKKTGNYGVYNSKVDGSATLYNRDSEYYNNWLYSDDGKGYQAGFEAKRKAKGY